MPELTPSPNNLNRTVRPPWLLNSELRTHEYLLPEEVYALITAAKKGDYGHRDATLSLTTRMACALSRHASFSGSRSISTRQKCTSGASRMERQRCIRS